MARIVFVQNIFREYPAFTALSADLKMFGHDVGVVVGRGEIDIVSAILRNKPDIVGFSPTVYDIEWCLNISKDLNNIGVEVILGGAMVTANQDVITNPNIDYICIGEGELCMRQLLDLKDSHKGAESYELVPNLVFKKNGIVIRNEMVPLIDSIDVLATPDHGLYRMYPQIIESSTAIFTFMRGCRFNCSFCFNHVLQERYQNNPYLIRRRSPLLAIEEIEITREARKRSLKILRLFDSSLLSDTGWAKKFLGLYRDRIKLPFVCFAHPSEISYEMSNLLKESGCIEVGFSIESGSQDIRNKVLRKAISQEQILKAVEALKLNNLSFVTFNMLGSPGESWEQLLETIEINQKIKPMIAWASLTQVYRGTTLERTAIKLEPSQIQNGSSYGLLDYRSKIMTRIFPLGGAFSFLVRYPKLSALVLGRNYPGRAIMAKVMSLISFLMQCRRPALSFKEFVKHYIFEEGHGTGYY